MSMAAVLATALVTTVPAPPGVIWTETPVPERLGVVYTTDEAAGERWAVGIGIDQKDELTTLRPLALRWDGSRWQPTAPAVPYGRNDDVVVRARNDVWAGGQTEYGGRPGTYPRALLQHWNGTTWREVETPVKDDFSGFTALETTADGAVLAATNSSAIVRIRDGKAPEMLPAGALPDEGYVDDLHELPNGDLLVAGQGGLARFDGSAWHQIDLPVSGMDGRPVEISQLLPGKDGELWAAGMQPDSDLRQRPLVLHYDGTRWSVVPTPAKRGQLHGLALAGGRLIAVGGDHVTETGLVLKYTGTAFEEIAAPPNAGYLHSAEADGGCLWVTGGVATQFGSYTPSIVTGQPIPDAFPPPKPCLPTGSSHTAR